MIFIYLSKSTFFYVVGVQHQQMAFFFHFGWFISPVTAMCCSHSYLQLNIVYLAHLETVQTMFEPNISSVKQVTFEAQVNFSNYKVLLIFPYMKQIELFGLKT